MSIDWVASKLGKDGRIRKRAVDAIKELRSTERTVSTQGCTSISVKKHQGGAAKKEGCSIFTLSLSGASTLLLRLVLNQSEWVLPGQQTSLPGQEVLKS